MSLKFHFNKNKLKNVNVYYFYGEDLDNINTYIFRCLSDSKELYDVVNYNKGFLNGNTFDYVKIAFYPDFTDRDMKSQEFIKFINIYSTNLNIKSGYFINNYSLMIFTSVQHPNSIYEYDLYKNLGSKFFVRYIIIIFQF